MNVLIDWSPTGRRRNVRPGKNWENTVEESFKYYKLSDGIALDREEWKRTFNNNFYGSNTTSTADYFIMKLLSVLINISFRDHITQFTEKR